MTRSPRSVVLLLGAVGCLAVVAQILARGPGRASDLVAMAPVWAQAVAWLVPASVAAWCAFRPGADGVGFAVLVAAAAVRSYLYAMAWAGSWVSPGADRYGWFGAVAWAVLAVMYAGAARWLPGPTDARSTQGGAG